VGSPEVLTGVNMNKNFAHKEPGQPKEKYELDDVTVYLSRIKGHDYINVVSKKYHCATLTFVGKDVNVTDWWGWGD